MLEEAKFINSILPEHYTCLPKDNGVHCFSSIGIDDVDEENLWEDFKVQVKNKFGSRVLEFFSQVSTNHLKFTVYLKETKILKDIDEKDNR